MGSDTEGVEVITLPVEVHDALQGTMVALVELVEAINTNDPLTVQLSYDRAHDAIKMMHTALENYGGNDAT